MPTRRVTWKMNPRRRMMMSEERTLESGFAALSFESLCRGLTEPQKTLIICHARPDGDAIGSAFALKSILQMTGSEAYCICADEVPKRLKFLTASIQSSSLIDSLPEDFLPERIITVDTASVDQMGKLGPALAEMVTVMIDHHKSGEKYADYYVDINAAATGEIIFRIATALLTDKGRQIPLDVCRCLYAAISSDTGCFKYSNVTASTHMAAASLVRSGIDTAEINRLLFDSKNPARLNAERIGLENLKTCCDGKIAIIALDYDEIIEAGVDVEELDAFIDVARCVDGVEVALAIKQHEKDGKFRVSMRSNGNVDVSEICASFGGGGHARAAGCGIDAEDKRSVAERVLRAVVEKI